MANDSSGSKQSTPTRCEIPRAAATISTAPWSGSWQRRKRRLRHLPGACSPGIFLQNGARFYVDCGLHPELTTPSAPTRGTPPVTCAPGSGF